MKNIIIIAFLVLPVFGRAQFTQWNQKADPEIMNSKR
jgi:hypothetical protein